MIDLQHIRKLTEDKLQGSAVFVVDLLVKPGNRIFVFLDGDRSITIEDCASLSRYLESTLAEGEEHELVVSSCGADQPLRMARQYPKHVGRSFTVKLADDTAFTGELTAVSEEGITLKPEQKRKNKKDGPVLPETIFLSYSQIVSAKVNISFNKK